LSDAPVWDLCKNIPYSINKTGTWDIYNSLEKKNYRVLKFSGDTDFTISTQGTREWIDALSLPIQKNWSQYFVKDQVGGYVETLGSTGQMTFATIHAAGHQPALTRPDVLYHVVFNFIQGKKI